MARERFVRVSMSWRFHLPGFVAVSVVVQPLARAERFLLRLRIGLAITPGLK